ncbi:glycogenin-2 isoform X3 [Dendroctonus ponderosae]|uniref:glycogenin-2 isoform X3 n=1 Tax=Dendroctonus ponderosae TaxID=77166 RepID=UPI002034F124|nr:glycogenin-2 isoform X3 [Dendroctonus ponderosae]
MGGSAWVTLATNDSYSLGALVLAHSLKQTGTVHQLAVLVTPGVTSAMREKLSSVFNLVQEVNILDSRDEANLRLLKRPELGITFTKLHCWRLTQFDKCVFLDADTLVLKNSDELFEREELSAAPDVGWPDCFNSGVFVYRPSLETYDKLIQFALEKGSFDGGDQGLLNLFFSDWAHKDISKHLPFIYNLCSTACYSYLPAFKQFGANAKIIHFIGAQKPWLQYFNTETKKVQPSGESSHLQEVLQLWWNIFCSLIHPHLSPAMQGQSQHGMSPSYFPPEFHPSPNPTASADDYESAWDPWDEYDEKISQNTNNSLISTHYNQNQPIESLNTNTSRVANQPSIHSHSQSHNYSTYTVQNNSYYQPSIPTVLYQHIPRVPAPSPIPQEVYSPAQFHPSIQHPEHNLQHHHETHQQPSPCPPQHFLLEQLPQRPDAHYYPPEPQQHHQFHNESQFPQPHDHHHHEEPEKFDHYDQPHVHYAETHSPEEPQSHFTHQEPQVHEQFTSPSPVRSRSPKAPDQSPVLPKECEATTTVSNSRSLSITIEENSSQEDAGLAGAFSQLTLGVARTVEQDALENVLRKQAWEVGNIDYLGKDSFENIWSKISETLSAAPHQPEELVAAESELPTASAEPEIAPAESQSQTELRGLDIEAKRLGSSSKSKTPSKKSPK